MGRVTVHKATSKEPLSLGGELASYCWNTDPSNEAANLRRGINCIKDGHGRVGEFGQVYLILEGYSARLYREVYTHIGSLPTRLQASTRYLGSYYEGNFPYLVPKTIFNNKDALAAYEKEMANIGETVRYLVHDCNIPKEDAANLLPLGMESTMVLRTNMRHLMDMMSKRLCKRAYWEFRELMEDIKKALSEYSEEWKIAADKYFVPICELQGYCTETYTCGRRPKKEEVFTLLKEHFGV